MNKLVILSGAGLSADSGVPTFRSQNGLWMNHDIDKVCNYTNWKDNIELVHNFYNGLRGILLTVSPNPAHFLLAEWQQRWGEDRVLLLTANVDDLLERAGCSKVTHLHGNLLEMQCTACGHVWNIGYAVWDHEVDRCTKCSSRRGVKPGVVFFHENAPLYKNLYLTFYQLHKDDIVLVVGTSGQVINVDSLLFDRDCYKILNNLNAESFIDESIYDFVHYGKAANAVGILDSIVKSKMLS